MCAFMLMAMLLVFAAIGCAPGVRPNALYIGRITEEAEGACVSRFIYPKGSLRVLLAPEDDEAGRVGRETPRE